VQLTRDVLLDEESRMLSRTVAEFREQVLADRARDLDEEASSGIVEETFKRAASLGLAAALVSEEAGGQGMDTFSFCLALEEVAQGSAGLAALMLSHNMALRALERAGALPDAGELLSGGEWAAAGWPLDTEGARAWAPFVPGGSGASLLVMVTPDGGVSALAPGEDGLSVEEVERPMGWRASRPASVSLPLTDAARAGSLSDDGPSEFECAMLAGLSAIALGISRHAFDKARVYATERWQACDYIVNHQQMRLMLGGMLAGIETGEAALRQLALQCDGGPGALLSHRSLKILTCGSAMQAALDGVQMHGGYGYMRDYGMELLMRDAKTCQVYPRSPQEETLSLLELETDR
jgi:acyl-CoA dehydrogenase